MPPQPQWLSPEEVLQRIQQIGNPEWTERGSSIIKQVVAAFKQKHTKKPEVKGSPYGKKFIKAAPPGPKFTASTQDATGRHNCFRGGERVECEQFGGEGEGWSELRSQEDLYDAARRLVNELKAGKYEEGWHEILGLLIHTDPEELNRLKNEHNLSAPSDVKEAIIKKIQEELQHVGHQVEEGQKSYHVKAEGDEAPSTPEPNDSSSESITVPPQQQAGGATPPIEPTPPEDPDDNLDPEGAEIVEGDDEDDPDIGTVRFTETNPEGEEVQSTETALPLQEEDRWMAQLAESRRKLVEYVSHEPPGSIKLNKQAVPFLQNMKEDPYEDAPRLIFADWYEENYGQNGADFAELIRLEVEFEKDRITVTGDPDLAERAWGRVHQLEMAHPEWFWPWENPFGKMGGVTNAATFVRGMMRVESHDYDFGEIMRRVGPERALALVEKVKLHGDNVNAVIGMNDSNRRGRGEYIPWLTYITSLDLSNNNFSHIATFITSILGQEEGSNLRELDLFGTDIVRDWTGRSIRALLERGNLKNLESLDLGGNDFSEGSLRELLNSPHLNNLKELRLTATNIRRDMADRFRARFGNRVKITSYVH